VEVWRRGGYGVTLKKTARILSKTQPGLLSTPAINCYDRKTSSWSYKHFLPLYEMASVSLTPRPLHLWGKNSQQPFNWQLDGAQRECGRSEEETNPCPYRE